MAGACRTGWLTTGLNEVQPPKELQGGGRTGRLRPCRCLNEVQPPKELQASPDFTLVSRYIWPQ